jgi:hypothetical protein
VAPGRAVAAAAHFVVVVGGQQAVQWLAQVAPVPAAAWASAVESSCRTVSRVKEIRRVESFLRISEPPSDRMEAHYGAAARVPATGAAARGAAAGWRGGGAAARRWGR